MTSITTLAVPRQRERVEPILRVACCVGHCNCYTFGRPMGRTRLTLTGNSEPRGPGINRAGLALLRHRTRCCWALATRG